MAFVGPAFTALADQIHLVYAIRVKILSLAVVGGGWGWGFWGPSPDAMCPHY